MHLKQHISLDVVIYEYETNELEIFLTIKIYGLHKHLHKRIKNKNHLFGLSRIDIYSHILN